MGFSTHYGGLNGTAGIDLQLRQHHHNFNGLVATLVSCWGLGENTIWNPTKLMKDVSTSTSRKQQQPTEQHHKAMSWSREELEGMARKAIQQLAKENGIKANAKVGCMSCLTVPFTRFVRGVRELAIAMSALTGRESVSTSSKSHSHNPRHRWATNDVRCTCLKQLRRVIMPSIFICIRVELVY